MSYLTLFLTLWLLHVTVMVSPGPNVFIVMQMSASTSRKAGVWTALGVASAAFFWVTLAVTGVNLVFEQVGWLFTAVRLAGAAYLFYLGLKAWWNSRRAHALSTPIVTAARPWDAYRLGLSTNLTNPKTVIFFSTILTTVFVPPIPDGVKVAVVGLITLNAVVWHVLIALLFSTARLQSFYVRSKQPLNQLMGTVLIFFAVRLLWAVALGG